MDKKKINNQVHYQNELLIQQVKTSIQNKLPDLKGKDPSEVKLAIFEILEINGLSQEKIMKLSKTTNFISLGLEGGIDIHDFSSSIDNLAKNISEEKDNKNKSFAIPLSLSDHEFIRKCEKQGNKEAAIDFIKNKIIDAATSAGISKEELNKPHDKNHSTLRTPNGSVQINTYGQTRLESAAEIIYQGEVYFNKLTGKFDLDKIKDGAEKSLLEKQQEQANSKLHEEKQKQTEEQELEEQYQPQ